MCHSWDDGELFMAGLAGMQLIEVEKQDDIDNCRDMLGVIW